MHVWGAFRREPPSSDGTTLTHTWLRSAWPHKAASESRRCPGQREDSPVTDFLPGIDLAELNPGRGAFRSPAMAGPRGAGLGGSGVGEAEERAAGGFCER